MSDNITIRDLVDQMNRWLKFKRTSAADTDELPTLEMAGSYFRKAIISAAKDMEDAVKVKLLGVSNNPQPIELLTLYFVWQSSVDGMYRLNLGQYVPPTYNKVPLVVFTLKTKEVKENGKTYVVPLSIEPYDSNTLDTPLWDIFLSMASACQFEPDFFERWKNMPSVFRGENPICPICGGPIRLIPKNDFTSAGTLTCSYCDWESHNQNLYPDEMADEKVMGKERQYAKRAIAAKKEVELAAADVKAALSRLQEAKKKGKKYLDDNKYYKTVLGDIHKMVASMMDDKAKEDLFLPEEETEEEEEGDNFKAYAFEDDSLVIADWAPFETAEEAIAFAKSHNWDEVENVTTGEILYRRR